MNKYKLESGINEAMSKGLFEQVKLLIDLGYNVNSKNHRGQTPIMVCALIEDIPWALSLATALLQSQNVNLNLTDFLGFSALHLACHYNREHLVCMLVNYQGFNTQIMDILYNRPFHYAAVNGNPNIMALLLENEMRVQRKPSIFMTSNILGYNPITLAKMFMNRECFILLRDFVGDIKFPSKNDIFWSRKITDECFSKENCIQKLTLDDDFFIKYNPGFKMNKKVRSLSTSLALNKVGGESHYDNEASTKMMPKYAMHFSLDLRNWNYLNVPRYVEKKMKLEEIKSNEEDDDGEKGNSIVVVQEKKDKIANVNKSNNKEDIQLNVRESVKEGEENDGTTSEKSEEKIDYSKVCKSYRMKEWLSKCDKEESDKDDDDENKLEGESNEKSEGLEKDIKEDEEEEKEECFEDDLATCVTEYQKTEVPMPLVWHYRSTCIQDKHFTRYATS